MKNINEIKDFFKQGETKSLCNNAANWQFVHKADGTMFQYSNGKYTFYKTANGFYRAVLYRIKRG
jgi:hypothetical protein